MSMEKIEKMTLVPGARISVTSKADLRYEGMLVSFDKEKEELTLAHVLWFGKATADPAQSPTTAECMGCGYVTFSCSELKEVQVLDATNPRPTDPAVVTVSENCTGSRAVTFSKQVLTWIENGENEKLTLIIENSHIHDSFDAEKRTLLHHAVQHSNMTIVRKLLRMGCDVNAQDSMGDTPLMVGMAVQPIESTQNNILSALLAAGADSWMINKKGKSAVHTLCKNPCAYWAEVRESLIAKVNPIISEYEVDRFISAGCTIAMVYDCIRDTRAVELMIQRGAAVDGTMGATTALHLAATNEDLWTVELLLRHGANVHLEDEDFSTPWSQFEDCQLPKEEAKFAQLLLEYGDSPTTCDSTGFFNGSAFLWGGRKETIKVMLQHGLDFTATDAMNKYALHHLAENRNPGVVEELERYRDKINANVRDEEGETPLHYAARSRSVDMVAFLLSMGAEVDCRTLKGFTPLYSLCAEPHILKDSARTDQCIELLLQHHADPQLVVTTADGRQITILEASRDMDRTKRFVAQIALLERRGSAITEIAREKINSQLALKEHLSKCQALLTREILSSTVITLYRLMTADKKNVAKFLENGELVSKLQSLFEELQSSSPFYYDILRKKYEEGAHFRDLRRNAAVSICKILGNNVDERNLSVLIIVDFLDDRSLTCLEDLF